MNKIEKDAKMYAMAKLQDVVNRGLRPEDYVKPRFFQAVELEKAYLEGAANSCKVEEWFSAKIALPSSEFWNLPLLVRCWQKNRENTKYLYDICTYDEEGWSDREYTWEKIVDWKPIN